MSKFTKIEAKHDIKVNNQLIITKGTKGIILSFKENKIPYVRFSSGTMLTVASKYLLAL